MISRLRLQPADVGMGMTSQRVRDRLIDRLRANGIVDERVLNAIRTVPRHQFIGELLRTARKRFRNLGLHVRSKHDDGRIGWPEEAPFDGIIVTAAAPALVDALSEQLAPGGTLVAPVGGTSGQSLLRLRKHADGNIEQSDLGPVIFVPLLSGMTDQ